MDDNRKVAVAFGSFACVVEGYEEPFKVIQRVVRFFERQAEENPNFGDWQDIGDVDDLRARLENLSDGPVEIETMPGGVRVRRLIAEAAEDAPKAEGSTGEMLAGGTATALAGAAVAAGADDAEDPVAAEDLSDPQETEDITFPSVTGPVETLAGSDTAQDAEDEEQPEVDAQADANAEADAEAPDAEAAEADPDPQDDGEPVTPEDAGTGYGERTSPNPFARDTGFSDLPPLDMAADDIAEEPETDDSDAQDLADLDDESRLGAPFSPFDALGDAAPEPAAEATDGSGEPEPNDEAASPFSTAAGAAPSFIERIAARHAQEDGDADNEDTPTEAQAEPEDSLTAQGADAADEQAPEEREGAEASVADENEEAPDPADAPVEMHTDEPEEVEEAPDEVVSTTEDTPQQDPRDADPEEIAASADTPDEAADSDAEDADAREPSEAAEPAAPAPLRLGETPPATAPLRLGEEAPAKPAAAAPLRLTPEAGPLKLGEATPAAASAQDGDAASAEKPMSLGRPLFRRKAQETEAPAAPPPNQDNGPSFIDSLSTEAETEETPPKPAVAPVPEGIAATISEALEDDSEPAKKPRGLGSLLRRKQPSDLESDSADEDTDTAAEPGPRLVPLEEQAAADAADEARKPGSLLRVVADSSATENAEDTPAEPEDAEAAKPARGGFRSFLRGKGTAAPTADAPEAASPAPQDAEQDMPAAEPPKPRQEAEPAAAESGDAIRNRLHASFAEAPEPTSIKAFELEAESDDEEVDAFTPLGFARQSGAKSLPELMTAATAYLSIVENRSSVSRADIVEVVQQIAGDTPLTAEAKVKAVGKLVRSGTLVRLEGGQFMLDEVETQRFRERMEGAA